MMSESPSLSCSIVSYGHPQEMLFEAVCSVRASWSGPLRLALVDNRSDSKLGAWALSHEIEYLDPGSNIGFGAAHNLVLRSSKGQFDFHLVLNPDVRFGPEVLRGLAELWPELESPGVVAPLIRYPDRSIQHLCKRLPSPADLFARRFLPGFVKPWFRRGFEAYEFRMADYTEPMQVPVLSGCFMMFDDALLSKLEGFDERFFLYLEDVDFCRRSAQIARNHHRPEFEIVHDYGKDSYRSLRSLRLHAQSAVRYFNKWSWLFDSERKRLNETARYTPLK